MSSTSVDARVATTDRSDTRPLKDAGHHVPHRWWVLAVIGLAQLMVVLDATIVNIALPSAQRDLGFSNDGRQWIVTGYALAFGSLLLLGGRLADLLGRRTTFLIGLVGFGAASALGGASNGFAMLVIARALQGLFGAVLAPSAMSLLTTTFTDVKERARAFGIFGAIAGSGGAIGLLLGGLLTEHLNWRWTMYVNVVIAVFAVVGAIVFVRRQLPAERPKLDILGVALVAAGLFGLVYGFSNAETHSWGNWMCWAFLAAGGVLLALFVLWETRARHPLLPLRVLGDRNRAGAYVSVFVSGAGMFGVFLFLTYYLEVTLAYSPVKTGLAFLPMVGALMVTAQLSINVLVPRIGPKAVVPVGMGLAAGGMAWLTELGLHSGYAAHILPPLLMLGVGLGLVMPPAMSLATLGVAPADQGVASAMVNTMQQVGGSIGTALFNTIAATAATNYAKSHLGMANLAAHAGLHSYAVAYWAAAGFFAAGLVISLLLYRRGRPMAQVAAPSGAASAAKPGADPVPPPVTGSALSDELSASPFTGVRGRVLGAGGVPVPRTAVTLISPSGRQLARAIAAEDGRYAVDAPQSGSYVLVASAPGHQPQVATMAVGSAPVDFDPVLAGIGGLAGSVRAAGAPLPGALVVVTDERGEVVGSTTSDADGDYLLAELVPGDYTLTVNAPGHRPSSGPVLVAGDAPTRYDAELSSAVAIHGTVRNRAGDPVEDARVSLLDATGSVVGTHTTGIDGAYAFADLPGEQYTLIATGYPPVTSQVTVTGSGQEGFDLSLGHGG
ncbi:MFS transporter [Streptantibioticus ferralitis]|uniref:DHA2 family efflux MFS transporter permease subunit n=1 Tax=Streptantibioticus ferralitis TaxID=236510 RepID=A0ABT5YUC8_9ACTN|nr:MFS transporter [Streptantibioticus ferralitis]MDF2255222.1 DHA2 family efflux MFS transporter permease subunit [Streptantibioticus ferralitis]